MTRVVLYGRAGCHLCDEAREVVRAVCAETGDGWTEVDIDAGACRTSSAGTWSTSWASWCPWSRSTVSGRGTGGSTQPVCAEPLPRPVPDP